MLAGSVVLGWVLHQIPGLRRRHWWAYGLGLVLCAGTAAFGAQPGGLVVATLAPFGVILPALCLHSSFAPAGREAVPRGDLLVLSAMMLVVAFGAAGVLPLAPYGWFYAGVGPALLAFGLGVWALWRRQIEVLGAVALAQVLWLLDVGSSNLYAHLSHLVLIPALALRALRPG